MDKKLALKKETLARLDNYELTEVVGGTFTATCGCTGYSCASVCIDSGYCPTYTCPSDTCPAATTLTVIRDTLQTIL